MSSRISAVLGIHQGLGILFPTEQLGVEWLRTPHNAVVFGGRPPLDLASDQRLPGWVALGAPLPRRRVRGPLHAAERH